MIVRWRGCGPRCSAGVGEPRAISDRGGRGLHRRDRCRVRVELVARIAPSTRATPLAHVHHARGSLGRSRASGRVSVSAANAPVHIPQVCGKSGNPPRHYTSIVVFSFENRTWNEVGMGFGRRMPYLHALGRQCSYFTDWRNADPRPGHRPPNGRARQRRAIRRAGHGNLRPATFDNCHPSATCSTTANNIFRQARRAGLAAVNYVEGAYTGCSAVTQHLHARSGPLPVGRRRPVLPATARFGR